MGLAASQARFLGLTARKSNVEYQGQQINQQRVALSNEVMGLYNEYNNLAVPVPPLVQDYQKTVYKVDSTPEDYQIESFNKIISGPYEGFYDVTLSWQKEVAKAYMYTCQDSVITALLNKEMNEDGEETTNGFSYLNFQLGMNTYTYDENDIEHSTITKITGDYDKYQGLTTIMQSQGLEEGTFYMYMKDGIAYYTSEDDLMSTEFDEIDGKNTYYGAYSFDYQGSQKDTQYVNAKAALTQESSGRLATIQFLESEDAPELVGKTYSITTGSEDDQQAYDSAMNEYYYQKALYEKEVERINLKTETIQKEDRSLELQLNQLDTEQKAISTEMDSVSKVIQDTVDAVFKTFE